MTDIFTKEKRTEIMRKVKSKNTSIEIKLRKELWKQGIKGWRINYNKIIGSPDIAFIKIKLAIFIDGCFWHGCPKCNKRSNSNKKFWDNKIVRNQERDKEYRNQLKKIGWKCIAFWEHDINKNLLKCAHKIIKKINSLKKI